MGTFFGIVRELAKFIGNGAGQPEFSGLKKSLHTVIFQIKITLRPVISLSKKSLGPVICEAWKKYTPVMIMSQKVLAP